MKRVGDFSRELAALKDEEKIHKGIKRMCKSWTDKADKRFVRAQSDDSRALLAACINNGLTPCAVFLCH